MDKKDEAIVYLLKEFINYAWQDTIANGEWGGGVYAQPFNRVEKVIDNVNKILKKNKFALHNGELQINEDSE